jgi:5'-nucleotidase / UDP-sugar diphosphatase
MFALRHLPLPIVLAAAAILASGPAAFAQAQDGPVGKTSITFLLTNDIYSMGDTPMPDGRRRGGFARLAAVVKAERARAAAEGRHVIFAHGGDTLSPSLMSGIDRGEHIVALTNMIPPDIFAPGNHEFDFGKAVFLQRMREAKFPLFAANMRDAEGKPIPGFQDRTIVTRDGIRIGLTGIAYDRTPQVSSPEDIRFAPTVGTAREQAEHLAKEGADFVVAVLHADRQQAIELAATNTVQLILTGHNHDLYVNYDGQFAMAESSYDAIHVVAVDVTIETAVVEGQRSMRWWPRFRIVDTADVTPDPEVAQRVAAFEADLSREMDVALAQTAVELDSRNATVRLREAAIGNLIADAMRVSTGATIAVMNGGGIRANKVYPANSAVTRRDILAELPFGNRVMVIDVSGRDLRQSLENGFSRLPDASGRFPQVSGLTIEIDATRPAGSRILSIRTADGPLDLDRIYRIATNDFLARGADGYDAFGRSKPMLAADDAPLLANEVMVHVRKLGTVKTGTGGRIVQK